MFMSYDSTVGKSCQLQIIILHIALITICSFFSGKKLQFVYCSLFPSNQP
jgi:Ca2+/H+ antiporter